jgi:hypothetical protein
LEPAGDVIDVIEALQAAEVFLLVVLAERPGMLTTLQRDFLESTLAHVRHSAERLHSLPAASDWPARQATSDEPPDRT